MGMDNQQEDSYTYKDGVIESVSDVLNIIQQPLKFFSSIIDAKDECAPLGYTDAGFPRPYPFGVWFRGHADASWKLNPDVFRSHYAERGSFDYYDEKQMFHDLRLRSNDFPIEGNSNFDLISLMKHHGLPTRLLDWSENILVALFFAVARNYERNFRERPSSNDLVPVKPKDAALYVLNAYRLNSLTSVMASPGIMSPTALDVSLRTAQAEHIYIQDAIETGCLDEDHDRDNQTNVAIYDIQRAKDNIHNTNGKIEKLLSPIAMIPKRKHPRMTAQLSTFTVHGGKIFEGTHTRDVAIHQDKPIEDVGNKLFKINEPTTLNYLNNQELQKDGGEPFLLKFKISGLAIKRIMVELDRMGITEPVIYPDMQEQINFMKRRWGKGISERRILTLPLLKEGFGIRQISEEINYVDNLYGSPSTEDGTNKRFNKPDGDSGSNDGS